MKFGPVPVNAALGHILAHSVRAGTTRIRKGKLLQNEDITALAASGVTEVTVARLDPGDIAENAAAERLARALAPDPAAANLTLGPATTGRVNLIAAAPGLARIEAGALHALNSCDPMITCATVPDLTRMTPGGLLATIKIISYAVPSEALAQAVDAARGAVALIRPQLQTACLIVTETSAGPDSAKGIQAVEMRLTRLGMVLEAVKTVAHDIDAIRDGLTDCDADLALILTASATSDAHDVAPQAVRRAGGRITRFGMPVDPGNLLFSGAIGAMPVIGLPGCARSPALNGADWILERTVCGLTVTSDDIAAMGVGGLLKEIPQRPQPRGDYSV